MRSPLAQRDWGRFGIGHDDYSHAHVERKHSHRNFAAANSLSLSVFVCVCMCMCVRACIQYNMNMLQIPATTESCPGQELKNQVRPCGLAMQCDRPRFDIRHCSSNHFWHSEHGKARTPFLLFQCMFFLSVCAQSYTTHQTWLERTWPTQIVCEADGAVGTFVPLPVESEMCRKVWNVSFFSCFIVFWCFGFRTYGSKLSGAYFHFNV